MAAILLMFSTMVCRSAENASYLDRVNFAEWNNTSNTKKTTNTNNTTDTKNTKKQNTKNTTNTDSFGHQVIIFRIVCRKCTPLAVSFAVPLMHASVCSPILDRLSFCVSMFVLHLYLFFCVSMYICVCVLVSGPKSNYCLALLVCHSLLVLNFAEIVFWIFQN